MLGGRFWRAERICVELAPPITIGSDVCGLFAASWEVAAVESAAEVTTTGELGRLTASIFPGAAASLPEPPVLRLLRKEV